MRENLLFTLALTGLITGCASDKGKSDLALKPLADARKPMNVVFILSDDHRYDYMGFMGTIPWLETPSMDRMAREGAHIKNAFVTTSLSSPSRASILTGMYSHEHTVVDNTAPLPEGLTFFPQYLQAAGYRTAFFGKWHMGNDSGAPQPGFDHWEGFKGQGEYYNPRINTNGEWIQYKDSTYVTDLLTDHALKFIDEQRQEGKPFFVYLSHKGVHDNFSAAKRHKDCYKDKELVLPATIDEPKYGLTNPPTIDSKTGKAAHGKDFYGEEMKPNWVKHQRESWHGVDYSYHGRPWKDKVRKSILACAGLDKAEQMVGYSFLPLLEGKDIPWRDRIFYEYYWEHEFPQTPTMHGVRTDRYKYIRYHGVWDTNEFYDLANDPDECHNLIASPEHQETIKQLNHELYDWLESTDGMRIPLKRTERPHTDHRNQGYY